VLEYIIRLKRKKKWSLFDRWVWVMAFRDARHNFSRLALFVASLVAGIAAVVSLDSLNHSLQNDIDHNAKELLGADLVVSGDRKLTPEVVTAFDSTDLQQASSADMASMVVFLHNGQSRLIRLVAINGPFPFYGKIQSVPENAYDKVKRGGFAMMDETLAIQYEVSSDDSIRIGKSVFKVAGAVSEIPGGGGIMATFTPSVYISMSDLDSTGLVQYGSRVNYKQFFRESRAGEAEEIETKLKPLLRKNGFSSETVESRKEGLGKAFLSIYQFFSLLAFVALILGCIGVASAVHIYASEKRQEVAVLRCVGSTGWQAFAIFFIQVFLLGILGSILGSLIGVGIQQVLPVLLKGVLPFTLDLTVSWQSLTLGIVLGSIVSVLFSVLPLVSVRFVPPLTVLRNESEDLRSWPKTKIFAILLIVLFPIAFAAYQTKSWVTGLLFFAGLALALGALAGVAAILLILVRKFFPAGASFVFKHSLANLYRPNNQTRILLVTIGLGAFIISTLNIVEQSMLSQVEFTGQENQSNTILFDIQREQKDGVVSLMKKHGLEVNQVVPIITCRISEVQGKTIEQIRQDTSKKVPGWALTREYRVTYRDSLHHSEELIKGDIQYMKKGRDSVWVTISEGMEENLGVTVGDSMVFDVQGIPVKAFISGIRKVDWPKDPPNFIFVFPMGVLDNAPQIYVTATRIHDPAKSREFQSKLVSDFPNVSLIDLRLILATVNQLFDKLGLVVRFLALFCVITGLIVLAGAVANSKFIRIKENVLLRTIGARTRQVLMITLVEYAWLGLFAAVTGMFLSLASGYVLTRFFFEMSFAFDWVEIITIAGGVVVLTVLIGWFNSREVINTPPLQVLRKES
jgi:putative ABC transport system permease protein